MNPNRNSILNAISSPFFLAIPLAIIIYYLLPPIFHKYDAKIVASETLNSTQKRFFVDLNYDDTSEIVEYYLHRGLSSTSLLFTNIKQSTIEQENLNGIAEPTIQLLAGDYNNNKRGEVYIFTRIDTQLFINCSEWIGSEIATRNKLVTNIELYNGASDMEIVPVGLIDINNDGYKEALFTVMAGFKLQPRALFAWDIQNDTIYQTPKNYSVFYTVRIDKMKKDSLVFTVDSWAPGNTDTLKHLPFHDQSAWIMVFDNELNFKHKPIEFPGFTSHCYTYLIKHKGVEYFFVYSDCKLEGQEKIEARVYDNNLNLLNTRIWGSENSPALSRILVYNSFNGPIIWHIQPERRIAERLDPITLKTNKKVELPPDLSIQTYYDVDNNGTPEIVAWVNGFEKMIIYKSDFSNPVYVDFNDKGTYGNSFSLKETGKKSLFSLIKNKSQYEIEYKKSSLFYLKFPIYIGIYLILTLFVYIIKILQKKRIEEKFAMERQISELQIKTLKNQADPHFIFNTLNSISSVIYKEDKDTAYDYLNDFSLLIRNVIIGSDKIQITLKEELEFIGHYLRLEKLRFKEKFDYSINVDENIDNSVKVPRMVLQTFIENAIKHGLMHKVSNGFLNINVYKKDLIYYFEIDDNGIGRIHAKEYNKLSTGKGLKIIDEIFSLYKKLYNVDISQAFVDKLDSNNVSLGTQVIIKMKQH